MIFVISRPNQFALLQWNMVTAKTTYCPISTDQTRQLAKPSTIVDVEAMAIASKPKSSANASVDLTEELVSLIETFGISIGNPT